MPPLYGLYADPAYRASITTVAAFNADTEGYSAAYTRSECNGADFAYYILHWDEIEATLGGGYDWTYFDRFVRCTSKPIVFNLAVVDGSSKRFPSGLSTATALNTSTVTAPLTTLITAMAARAAGRVVFFLFGNEIDSYLVGSAAARVAEYAAFSTR